jgi:hypothetical protein
MLDVDGHLLVTGDESGMVQIWYVHPMHDWNLAVPPETWLCEQIRWKAHSSAIVTIRSFAKYNQVALRSMRTLAREFCQFRSFSQKTFFALASCAMEKFVQRFSRNLANISAKFCRSDLPTLRFNVPPARAARRGAAH